MSYEMKGILKTMIDNNEPHWSADTMDMVRVEIHNVYAQAAKADEYEAKAEAYDDIRDAMEMQAAIGVSDEDTLIDIDHVIMSLIKRKEGGEFDEVQLCSISSHL